MNVFKRCDCTDTCRHPFWYRFRLHGREHRGSTKTANKTLAERIASRRHIEALEGREGLRRARSPLLSEHVKSYLKWTATAHKTQEKSERVLNEFAAFIGDKRLDQISGFDLERWKTARAAEVAKSTVNRELNVIRGCFTRAVEWKHLRESPAAKVAPFHVDDTRIRVLSEDEIRLVLTAAPADVALWCRVTLESLLRINEVLNIRREDVGASWVQVRRKGGRVQKVAISPTLRAALLGRAHKSGWIFGRDADGKPATREAASVAVGRAMRDLGLEGVSHHTMRHTGITMMLEGGINRGRFRSSPGGPKPRGCGCCSATGMSETPR